MKCGSIIAFSILLFSWLAWSSPSDPLDYWEKSPSIWKQMVEERLISVSAKNEDHRTHSKGAGLVKASVSEIWNFIQDDAKVAKTSSFLKTLTWNKETGLIDVHIQILYFNYHLKGRAKTKPDPENPRIELEVLEGEVIPFTAVLEIRSLTAQKKHMDAPLFPYDQTLVKITGISSEDRALSWPLRVALEGIFQRTAGALREAVEAEKKESTSP